MKKIALFFLSLLVSFFLILQLPAFVSPSFNDTYAYAAKKENKDSLISKLLQSAVSAATRSVVDKSIEGALALIPGPRDHKYVIQVVNGTNYPLKLVETFKRKSSSWPLRSSIIPSKSLDPKNSINVDFGIVTQDEFDMAAVYKLDGNLPEEFYIMGAYRKGKTLAQSDKRIFVDAVNSMSDVNKYREYYLTNKAEGKRPNWVGRGNNEVDIKTKNNLRIAGLREKDKQYKLNGQENTMSAAVWNFIVSPPREQ